MAGESKDPDEAVKMIVEGIEEIKNSGIDQNTIERLLKAHKGKNLRSLDSVEHTAHSFLDLIFKECILFDYFDLYDRITVDYLETLLREHFNQQYFTVSKILPL